MDSNEATKTTSVSTSEARLDVKTNELSLSALEQLEGSALLEALKEVETADDFFARHSSHSSYSRYPSGPGGSWVR
jgi:hypothetical protein